MEEQLKLATIFTGRVDATFNNAVAQLRSLLQGLGKYGTAANAAAAQTDKLSTAHQGLTKHMQHTYTASERLRYALKITASYGLVSAAIYGTINALKTAVTEMGKFDQALKNIQAISSATDTAMVSVKNTLLTLAKDSRYSLTELSDAMVVLAQAGLSAEQSVAAIEAVATLATGTLSNMETTSDLLTTTLMSFNINAAESGRVADVMATAVNKSKLDVDKLRVAFNYVASSAHETGVSLNETAAAMMVLANHGQRASTIGTGLRQVFAKLLNPSKALKENMSSMGITLENLDPKTAGFGAAMSYVTKILWDQKNATVDMQKAYKLFELRGAQAAAILVKSYRSGEYQQMLEDTWEFGTAQEMAAKQSEGLAIKFQKLINQSKVLAVSIGDAGVVGALKSLLDILKNLLEVITDFTDSGIGQMTISFALWTATIWGTVRALKALGGAIVASKTLAKIGAGAGAAAAAGGISGVGAFALSAAPYLAIAAAIGGVVTVLYRLSTAQQRHIKDARDEVSSTDEAVTNLEAYGGALEDVQKRLNDSNLKESEKSAIVKEAQYLIKELLVSYPQLGDKVDEITRKYTSFKDVLDAVVKLEKEETILQQQKADTERIKLIQEETEALKKKEFALKTTKAIAERTISGNFTDEQKKNARLALESIEKQLDAYRKPIKDDIRNWILTLGDEVLAGTKTLGQAQSFLGIALGLTPEMFESSKKQLIQYIDRMRDEIKNPTDIDEKTGIFADMSDEMLNLYKSMSDAQKVSFIPDLDKLKDEKIKLEESLKTAGLSDIEIDAFVKIKDEEFINEWKEKIYKTQNEIKQLSIDETEARGDTLKSLQDELKLLEEKKKQALSLNAGETRDKAVKEANLAITKQELAIQAEKDKQLQDQRSLEVSILTLKKGSIAAQAQEIDNLRAYIAEHEKRYQSETESLSLAQKRVELLQKEEALRKSIQEQTEKSLSADVSSIQIKSGNLAAMEQELVNLKSKYYQPLSGSDLENKETVRQQQRNAIDQKNYEIWKAKYDIIKASQDIEIENTRLKEGDRAADLLALQYAKDNLVLLQTGELPTEERITSEKEQQLLISQKVADLHIDTPIQEFRKGIQETQVTYGEFWNDLGKQLPENFASGLANAMISFADRTKSAKEAFRDFAQSTIRWISEIIIKQMIMNAISSYFGKNNSQSMIGKETVIGHTGGVFGVDNLPRKTIRVNPSAFIPKFHSGYNQDEMLAIVKRKEGIFTESQMDALGAKLNSGGGGPSYYYDLKGSTFLDKDQMMRTMQSIANMEVKRSATSIVYGDIVKKDHPLRTYIRGGGR